MDKTQISINLDPTGRSRGTETRHFTYDTETNTASVAVVSAVMKTVDATPTEIDQLYHSIDTDALDMMFEGAAKGSIEVSFLFEGFRITVANAVDARPDPPKTA